MFLDYNLESKIQDDSLLDQECYPETKVERFIYSKGPNLPKVERFMLKALVSDQLPLFQLLVAYEIVFQ